MRSLIAAALSALTLACSATPNLPTAEPALRPTEATSQSRRIDFRVNEGTFLSFDLARDGWLVADLLGQLWRIPAAGGDAVPLTNAVTDMAEDLDPIISPDGRWIAFQGDRNGAEGLWLMAAAGGTPTLLPGTEASVRAQWKVLYRPAWSPDSREIVFVRDGHGFRHRLENRTTTELQLKNPPPGAVRCVEWLRDGRLLALISPPGGAPAILSVFDSTGTGSTVLTAGSVTPGYGGTSGCPAGSPDATYIAYFAEDSSGAFEIQEQPLAGGPAARLKTASDVLPSRIRYSPDGAELFYVARGRIWRAPTTSDGESREVPFTARVSFERAEASLPPVAFRDAGENFRARGHMGLALSPDATRIALLALGRLWVWSVGEEPRAIVDVPINAAWPSWSPDGTQLAWSAASGPYRIDPQDVYITTIGSASTRRFTRLAAAARPSWSPDGTRIAFVYGALGGSRPARFGVADASAGEISDTAQVLFVGEVPPAWYVPLWQERIAWSPASDALLFYQPSCLRYSCIYGGGSRLDALRILPLEAQPVTLTPLRDAATFLHWAADSSLIYVHGNQLWRAQRTGETTFGEPVLLTSEAALYSSVARDGSILYIGGDGLTLRKPDGDLVPLGWPLTFTVPEPTPVLIQNARIIDGTGAASTEPSDILLEHGRIARIARAGSIAARRGTEVIEADGHFIMPGLIDLHVHELLPPVAHAYLYHGVTTVRAMGHPMASAAALAEAVDAKLLSGPRIVLGGVRINPGSPDAFTGTDIQGTRNREESRRALLLARALGAAYIKMQFPARWSAGAELVREAHALGLRIGGHCAHALPLVAAGIAQVEHIWGCGARTQAPPRADMIELYRAVGLSAIPTLSVTGQDLLRSDSSWARSPDIAPFLPSSFQVSPPPPFWSAAMRRRTFATVDALHTAGVRIAAGTDIGDLPGVIHLELEELVRSGLTPSEAIGAATSAAARVIGAETEIGRVAIGMRADLILLHGNPARDIRNTRRIWKIIQAGRLVDRAQLLPVRRQP